MLAALQQAPSVKLGFRRIFDAIVAESHRGLLPSGCMIVNSTIERCGDDVSAFVKEADEASKRAFAAAIEGAQRG